MAKEFTLTEVFVGRNRVLEQFKVNFNQSMERRARVVFVAGEAGIGKTMVVKHFLSELVAQSIPLIFILHASCESGWSGDPYAPFARSLEGLPENAQKKLEKKLKYWARELAPSVIEGVIPFLGPVLAKALEIQLSRQSKQRDTSIPFSQAYQFLQFFEQLSKVCPLVLFIDDLHWADEASLNLISTLAHAKTAKQIMLIGTYRPHEIAGSHPLSKVLRTLRRNHLLNEITLQPFTSHDIEHFLNRCYLECPCFLYQLL